MQTFFAICIFLAVAGLIFFFLKEDKACGYYYIIGDSNGKFFNTNLCGRIYICEFDPYSFSVGEFPVRRIDNKLVVHPIISVIEQDGKVLGYITKGIENTKEDRILFPREIIGKAFRVFEDGSVEDLTIYTF